MNPYDREVFIEERSSVCRYVEYILCTLPPYSIVNYEPDDYTVYLSLYEVTMTLGRVCGDGKKDEAKKKERELKSGSCTIEQWNIHSNILRPHIHTCIHTYTNRTQINAMLRY